MNINESIGLASRVISAAVIEPGKMFWLCVYGNTLVVFPEKEIPLSANKVTHVNSRMIREGLSSHEWDLLENKLRFLCERKLL